MGSGVAMVTSDAMETDDRPSVSHKKYYIGSTSLPVPRDGMEVEPILNDGMGKWTVTR